MKTSTAQTPKSNLFLTNCPSNPPVFVPFARTTKSRLNLKHFSHQFTSLSSSSSSSSSLSPKCRDQTDRPIILETEPITQNEDSADGSSRFVVLGAVSVGLVLLAMGMEDHKAMALGPEGPLMEEFWDNVRRYALYALTVSTGALYAVFEPIGELLKNPISAILILVIFGGIFFILSQVLNAMVGVSNFSYDYSY